MQLILSRRPGRAALMLTGVALAVLLAVHGDPADIIKKAATAPTSANPNGATDGGLTNFVNAANGLIDPAIVAVAAVTPLACLVGAGSLMFGSRKGMVIIGAALGTLVFCASIKGIVA